MVWVVKYRKKILTPQIETEMQSIVLDIAKEKGFSIHLFEVGEKDHIHCFISTVKAILSKSCSVEL